MANGDIPTALLSYDPATGRIVWLVNKGIAKAGQVASSVNTRGYGRVKINGKSVLAHRLAWALHYGEWPAGAIDHINGIKTNNRLCNLRLATRAQNQQNRSSSTSHKGVTLAPDGKWLARCASNGKRHHIGRFESMDEALLAYRQVARQLHGSFFKE